MEEKENKPRPMTIRQLAEALLGIIKSPVKRRQMAEHGDGLDWGDWCSAPAVKWRLTDQQAERPVLGVKGDRTAWDLAEPVLDALHVNGELEHQSRQVRLGDGTPYTVNCYRYPGHDGGTVR